MKPIADTSKKLFEGVFMNKVEHELLELIKMDDHDLYRQMGKAGHETQETLRCENEYLDSPNEGDTEGKSPYFFRHEKVDSSQPVIHCNLPDDDFEAGKIIWSQMGVHLNGVISETAEKSPLFGYKQENVKLGIQCLEALMKKYPNIDKGILKPFVALRAKQLFRNSGSE